MKNKSTQRGFLNKKITTGQLGSLDLLSGQGESTVHLEFSKVFITESCSNPISKLIKYGLGKQTNKWTENSQISRSGL